MSNQFTEALKKGDLVIAEQLLKAGVDINAKDENGLYPIRAASHNDPQTLLWLINKGVDVNQVLNKKGFRLIDSMLDTGIDVMIPNEVHEVAPRIVQYVKILIENGADLSLCNGEGDPSLEIFNYYAGNKTGFNNLKDNFREAIPDIDSLITYKAKDW